MAALRLSTKNESLHTGASCRTIGSGTMSHPPLPRLDWSINFGHLLTILAIVIAGFAAFSDVREQQRAHTEQLIVVRQWIKDHETTVRINLEIMQELRTQVRLTTVQLEAFDTRMRRLEQRR